MQAIELMVRHPVDIVTQVFEFEERARHIEHESTIPEAGCIFYRKCPDGIFFQPEVVARIDTGREELEECLHAVILACLVGRSDGDAALLDVQLISFLRKALVCYKGDASVCLGLCAHGHGEVEHFFQLVLQVVG